MKKFPKKALKKSKPAKKAQEKVDPNIERVYEQEIEFMCPVRGLVKQKVKVKKYKTQCTDVKGMIVDAGSAQLSNIDVSEDLDVVDDEEISASISAEDA